MKLGSFIKKIFQGQEKQPDPAAAEKLLKEAIDYEVRWQIETLEDGGKIVDTEDGDWQELAAVYYKTDSSSRFQIEPKEDLKKRLKELNMTITSPDVADAGALTFADNSEIISDDDFEVV